MTFTRCCSLLLKAFSYLSTSFTMPGLAETLPAEVQFTLRQPPYSYFQLKVQSLQSASSGQSQLALDEITIRQYLAFAMQQYLGLTGAAVPIDVLKVEEQQAWVRVPHEDSYALTAALSQWTSASKDVSLRIVESGSWLGAVGRQSDVKKLWSLEE